jgi:hypothetical protein
MLSSSQPSLFKCGRLRYLWLVMALAFLVLVSNKPAYAQGATQVTSRAALGANDHIDWGQLGTFVPGGQNLLNDPDSVKSNGGMSVVASGTLDLFLDQQAPSTAICACWNGNFAPGDYLLGSGGTGALTLNSNFPFRSSALAHKSAKATGLLNYSREQCNYLIRRGSPSGCLRCQGI